ncbi:MAG: dihydrodipicolinate synthase family protein, partial [Clostridia bacterium]|nr:dihydrodipicolinate synthase family protein [Clostridia bacterium]
MNRHEKALEILRNGTVIPAIPLVLDENRKFDEKGQRKLTRYYLEAGAGGIAIAVHTTQFEIRDPKYNLFEKVITIVGDEIDRFEKETGKTIVKVSGICGKTEQSVKEAETIKALGYDAGLLSPGGLHDLTEEQMIERTRAVAKILPVIGFYLQRAANGRKFSYDYWRQICEIDNVVAIKCAPFNRYHTLDVVRAKALSSRADEIALYTGNDDAIVFDLISKYEFHENGKTYKARIVGGLLGHWSVNTHATVELFDKIKALDEPTDEILTLAGQVTDMNEALFDAANDFKGDVPGVHEMLRRQGLIKGIWCLDPNKTLSEGQAEEIE